MSTNLLEARAKKGNVMTHDEQNYIFASGRHIRGKTKHALSRSPIYSVFLSYFIYIYELLVVERRILPCRIVF